MGGPGHGEHEAPAAGHEGGAHEGPHEAPLWERMIGWGNAAVHAGGHQALHALEHAGVMGEGLAHGIGRRLPYVGAAIGAGQFGYHAHEAANTADNGSYTNNEHWNHTGEATLGAAGAAASFCPPAAMYLGAGELALDGVGALSGLAGRGINSMFGTHLDTGFSAGSVVGGIEHVASNASIANSPIMGRALMAACPALGLAANMGDVVTGSGQAIDAIGSGIGTAAHWVGDTASTVGGGIASGARTVGSGIASGARTVGSGIASGAQTLGNGIASGAQTLGNGIVSGAQTVANGASIVGHGIADGASAVGSGIASGARTVGSGIATGARAVGSGIASGASAVGNAASSAWDTVTSW